MGRHTAAILNNGAIYDDCLISSCLKKLFVRPVKSEVEPDFVISKKVGEFRKELEQMNTEGTMEMSYPYLVAMEESMPGAGFRYVVIYKQSKPVLFAYFQLCTLTSSNFSLEKDKSCVKGILRFFLDWKKIKVLISGNALRNDTVCCCFNESAISNDEATEIIASAAEKIAADEKTTAIILKDIPVSARKAKWLSGIKYQMPWEDSVMTVAIDKQWETLSGYVSALTRKYKARANKILASGSQLQLRQLTAQEIVQHEKEIYHLYKKVADGQPFVLIQPLQDHFAQLKKVYGGGFEVWGYFLNNKLIAFYSSFITDDAYELYYVGFDYELNSEYQLYFNILFAGLERAILLNKKQLKLGRTSFDAKASIGAKPVETNYFIKMPNIPDVVSNWFANYFSSMEDAKWKLRNPLKEVGA